MGSERASDTERRGSGRAAAAAKDSAADLAALTAKEPLSVLSEETGSDPYNHTGRFSVPDTEG